MLLKRLTNKYTKGAGLLSSVFAVAESCESALPIFSLVCLLLRRVLVIRKSENNDRVTAIAMSKCSGIVLLKMYG